MRKILFVCHGNICRSVACEFIFKNLVKKNNLECQFIVDSCATSEEEIGHDIYYPMKVALSFAAIPFEFHAARKLTVSDYEKYDLILAMDDENIEGIYSIIKKDNKKKIFLLTQYVSMPGIIDDPWYTRDFNGVVQQIQECLNKLLLKESKSF